MSLRKQLYILALAVASILIAGALNASAQIFLEMDEEDVDDADVRENPVIENDDDDVGIVVPEFIKLSANRINLNGADWSCVRFGINDCRRMPFSIVHIGDSHLQADIATGVTREMLQYDYGNAGRGLVVPLRMAGTNEPFDYRIKGENGSWISAKLLKRPWNLPMGFTGISVRPVDNSGEIYVATSEENDYNPFISITIYHNGKLAVKGIRNRAGEEVAYSVNYGDKRATIKLQKEETGVYVTCDMLQESVIYGVCLSGDRPGVFYNVIGNNGATFQAYNCVPDFGADIHQMNPGLIIVSLGTNEAFGSFNADLFKAQMKQLIGDIQKENNGVPVLLVTPMECQRSVYSTSTRKVVKKTRRGKKRSGRSRTYTQKYRVRSYAINQNVSKVRDAILDFGRENHIATFDWFDVAGGDGASTLWLNANLFGRDRVHHTARGYRLQGYLLYEALKQFLDGTAH